MLLILLGLIAGLLVAADVTARNIAEEELADRVAARVPEARSASARIRSFPFLPRLLGSGQVTEVDAAVTDVTVAGLQFASIRVALLGATISRREALDNRRVVLTRIERGRAIAVVNAAALSRALGVPVRLEPGRVTVTVGGVPITARVAVREGRLFVGGAGVDLPLLDLVAPLLPCVPDAGVQAGRIVLVCDFTEVPDELRVEFQL